jgi:hypothetical protein
MAEEKDRDDQKPEREGDVLGISDTPAEVEIPRATSDTGGHPKGIDVRRRTTGTADLKQSSGATGIDMGAGGSGTDLSPDTSDPVASDKDVNE